VRHTRVPYPCAIPAHHCAAADPEYNLAILITRSNCMDSEDSTGLVISIAIMIAVLAACGILTLVMLILIGVVSLGG